MTIGCCAMRRVLVVVAALGLVTAVGCGPSKYTANGNNNDNRNGDGGVGEDGGGGVCVANGDCTAFPDRPFCGDDGECVACVEGDAARDCPGTLTCCGLSCVETGYDDVNCGGCGTVCDLPNATASCSAGSCIISVCGAGWVDCDQDAANGCEVEEAGGGCACDPGSTESCYSGPPGTVNVGACRSGMRTCNALGTGYGPCENEVLPALDDCDNATDDDCDGIMNNGFPTGTGCVCTPADVQSCYNGPPGTNGVGPCHGGTWTCNTAGTGFGLCVGEQLPAPAEVCANGVDDDCNGVVDDSLDQDGDGWTVCDGDCCDVAGPVCGDPALVNPGAYEAPGNNVDDDCDGIIDNPPPTCDSGLGSNLSDPMLYAQAIDLCQVTTETGDSWGVISGAFHQANGAGTPNANQRSIRDGFGSGVSTQGGVRLAVLSTGHAADLSDFNPNYSTFQGGTDMGTSSPVPNDWLLANGGNLPNAPGCPDPQNGPTAYNPILLKLRIRVPTNAQSFSVNTYFYSAEYPEWVCGAYNDFFLVLLDSAFAGTPANPPDKNLALYTAPGNQQYPVGVNLAFGNTGLFKQCLNGPTGCGSGSVAGTTTSCLGTNELVGTGFDVANPPSQFAGDPGWCGASNLAGGGTGWLTTSGNVVGGEIIEIRFVVWDTGDAWYDSVVLLDNFQWSLSASTPGTSD